MSARRAGGSRVAFRPTRRVLRVFTSNFHNAVLRSKMYGKKLKKCLKMLSNVLVHYQKSRCNFQISWRQGSQRSCLKAS